MKRQTSGFIPAPVLAFPGVRALVDHFLGRASNEGEAAIADAAKEILLGFASVAPNLPAIILQPPAGRGARPALLDSHWVLIRGTAGSFYPQLVL